ncbi:MAG TPA: hypothetical protein DD706_24540 [Nitrospiraceae bacterium]|nr:hypothetical protein [Nitrospiraceae bacterium]
MNENRFVRAIILNDAGHYLALGEKRGTVKWNFPGGCVKRHETFEQAVCREIEEEIGLKVKKFELLHAGIFIFDGKEWEGRFFLVTDYLGEIKVSEPKKCICLEFFTLKELSKLNSTKEVLFNIAKSYKGILKKREKVDQWQLV